MAAIFYVFPLQYLKHLEAPPPLGNAAEKFLVLHLFPSCEAGKHLLNAKKEILLAVKSLIEKEVEREERKILESKKS
jgi:hypothetical protein